MKKKKKRVKKLRCIFDKLLKSHRKYQKEREKFLKEIPPQVWNKHF